MKWLGETNPSYCLGPGVEVVGLMNEVAFCRENDAHMIQSKSATQVILRIRVNSRRKSLFLRCSISYQYNPLLWDNAHNRLK